MRQIRISKRPRPARWSPEPLPPDARDPDIARAKQLARRAGYRILAIARARPGQSGIGVAPNNP